jgi:hypothetical protein
MNIKSEKKVTKAQALKLAGGALIIAGFLLALLNPLLAIVPVFLDLSASTPRQKTCR